MSSSSSSSSSLSLSRVEAKLPPGFRFHPRDDELICDYLMNKIHNSSSPPLLLMEEVDLNKCEPWDLPENACVGSGKEWYFYSQRDRKYSTGLRTNRATVCGYWKATGKDRAVVMRSRRRKQKLDAGTITTAGSTTTTTNNTVVVGMRKTLVFYLGRAPKGKKTEWVMHEFRLQPPLSPPPTFSTTSLKEDWVLCRVFNKNGDQSSPTAKQGGMGRSNIMISNSNSNSNSYYDDTISSSSSSLPSLMDSYITFDQTHHHHHHHQTLISTSSNQHQQVPCFSILAPIQTHPTAATATTFPQMINYYTTHVAPNMSSSTTPAAPYAGGVGSMPLMPSGGGGGGGLITTAPAATCLNPFSSTDADDADDEKNAIKAVLSHFNKMDTNYSIKGSLGYPQGSSESFLSQVDGVGLMPPTMWNHF